MAEFLRTAINLLYFTLDSMTRVLYADTTVLHKNYTVVTRHNTYYDIAQIHYHTFYEHRQKTQVLFRK